MSEVSLPPGKAQCPFHSHREEEEVFLVLEVEGELRFSAQRFRNKVGVFAVETGVPGLRKMFRGGVNVDYCDRESLSAPKSASRRDS